MRKILLTLNITFLICSCKQHSQNKSSIQSNSTTYSKDTFSNEKIDWVNSIILNYINNTDNELIKLARKDTIPEEWLFDRVEKTDSAKFLIFQIGHDVSEKNGEDKRFVTDSWVYIDSMTKKLYEYDLPNDSLIEWKK